MRILHAWEPHLAGVPRLASMFADHQVESGHDCLVLAPRDSWGSLRVAERMEWGLDRRDPASYATAARALREACRRFRPDVVHLHSFFAGLVGRAPGTVPRGATVVYQPHAWSFDVGGVPGRWATTRLERAAQRRTDGLITNCRDELDRGRRHGITTRGTSVGVAVDTSHLRPPTSTEREQARYHLGVTDDRVLVVVLGRLAHQKGQDLIVRAWERRPPPGAELVLQGAGDPSALARQAPSSWGRSVRHLPATDDVRDTLWAADILALPSRYETVSLVGAEALATGTPVVALQVDGIEELLEPASGDPAGAVLPPGDGDALVSCLGALARDPGRRRMMGAAGRRRVTGSFTPQLVGRRVLDSYAFFQEATP